MAKEIKEINTNSTSGYVTAYTCPAGKVAEVYITDFYLHTGHNSNKIYVGGLDIYNYADFNIGDVDSFQNQYQSSGNSYLTPRKTKLVSGQNVRLYAYPGYSVSLKAIIIEEDLGVQ